LGPEHDYFYLHLARAGPYLVAEGGGRKRPELDDVVEVVQLLMDHDFLVEHHYYICLLVLPAANHRLW